MGLVLIARRRDRLEALACELSTSFKVPVEIEVTDLADRRALERLAQWLERRTDVDLLVNNAGLAVVGPFWQTEVAKHMYLLDLQVGAPTRLTRAVLPQMMNRAHGAVVQVSSLAAMFSRLSSPTYGSSKAYLNAFSDSIREEMSGTNLCFQALCPGFTITEFHSTPEFKGIDVHAGIPPVLWLSVEHVVRESLQGLASGRRIVIPAQRYRWLHALGANRWGMGLASRWRAKHRWRRVE